MLICDNSHDPNELVHGYLANAPSFDSVKRRSEASDTDRAMCSPTTLGLMYHLGIREFFYMGDCMYAV